jgi:hypothetical protein
MSQSERMSGGRAGVVAVSVLLALCASGCGSGSSDPPVTSATSATPSAKPAAVAAGPGEVRLNVTTHCGVIDAEVDGVYRKAEPPLGNGNPPDGWGNPETPGRWQQTSDTTAVFKADSGVTAAFVRSAPDPTRGGCE